MKWAKLRDSSIHDLFLQKDGGFEEDTKLRIQYEWMKCGVKSGICVIKGSQLGQKVYFITQR